VALAVISVLADLSVEFLDISAGGLTESAIPGMALFGEGQLLLEARPGLYHAHVNSTEQGASHVRLRTKG
jgi:hypothetical protein